MGAHVPGGEERGQTLLPLNLGMTQSQVLIGLNSLGIYKAYGGLTLAGRKPLWQHGRDKMAVLRSLHSTGLVKTSTTFSFYEEDV